MKLFEITILVTLIIYLAGSFLNFQKKQSRYFYIPLISFLILILHIFCEGIHWQMIPAYGLTFFLFIANIPRIVHPKQFQIIKHPFYKYVYFIGILLIIFTLIPILFFPVNNLPKPSGPYSVGTRYLHETDSTRAEFFTDDTTDFREVTAQVWYPAEKPIHSSVEKYWNNGFRWSRIWTEIKGLNAVPFLLSHLSHIKTNSYLDTPMFSSESQYPVLLFSHGHWGLNKSHTITMEHLASFGYVVFSISHPFETPFIVYPDQSIKSFSLSNQVVKQMDRENLAVQQSGLYKTFFTSEDNMEKSRALKQIHRIEPTWQKSIWTWVEDIRFFLNQMPYFNEELGHGKFDLSRIGAFGWSYGGAAAGLLTLTDSRITAGINIDGWQQGHLLGKNFQVPFMFIQSEQHSDGNTWFYDRAENEVYHLIIKGTRHSNYTDFSYITGRIGKLSGRLGPINGEHSIAILNEYILGFFNWHLKKQKISFHDLGRKYPEVIFKKNQCTQKLTCNR